MGDRGFPPGPVWLVSAKEFLICRSVSACVGFPPFILHLFETRFGCFWGVLGKAVWAQAMLISLDYSQAPRMDTGAFGWGML